jgi:hypothetical protein
VSEIERAGGFKKINALKYHTAYLLQAIILILIILHVVLWTPNRQTFIDIGFTRIVWNTKTNPLVFGIGNPIPFYAGPSLQISLVVLGIFFLFETNKYAQRIFSTRFFHIIGKGSFSLYIMHIRK